MASDGKWYPPEAWAGSSPQVAQIPYAYGYPAAQPSPYPAAQPYTYPMPPGFPVQSPQNNGLAIASLVCSIAGIIPFLFGLPCVLGIIFGFVARGRIRRSNGTLGGDGMALAGIIVGFCLIGLFIVGVILVATLGHLHICTDNSNGNCGTN